MKTIRIILSIWLVMLPLVGAIAVPESYGQAATFPTQPLNSLVLAATATTANTAYVDLSLSTWRDAQYFTMDWYAFGTVSTCQVKAQQTADQSSLSDLIANQTCTSSGVTSTSALISAGSNYIRISLGTKSGSGTVLVVLNGYRQNPYGTISTTPSASGTQNTNITQVGSQAVVTNGNGVMAVAGAASSGMIVTTAACSGATCYTSPVMTGITTIASGSTSTIYASTTMLTGAHCTNITASAVNFTLTDGANSYLIGPNFSIPANSFLDLPTGLVGVLATSGVRASAGTAASVACTFNGKQ